MDFASREADILKYWQENHIFEKSVARPQTEPPFAFYDGPPTANGRPHIGHIETRAFKDIIPRYYSMKGRNVLRKAGWDTHGLPVELEVEKQLGINGKPQIEQYGVERFIEKCKRSVWEYKSEWENLSERVGFWADMAHPYITYENNYIESEWWALKRIWDKGLLYKGYRIVPYCPRCGTALSSHEVAQGYKDVKETSVFVKFRLKNEDAFILAWTTTPWTLPSNVALCVNAHETYARARHHGEVLILAQSLAEQLLGKDFELLESFPGAALEYMEYENLFGFYDSPEKNCYVVCDDFVTLTDGTGVVHIAPAFGEDDNRVGKKYGLPFIQLVNLQGRFVEDAKPYAGMFVKDADPIIVKDLAQSGKLLKSLRFEHSYPFCWRCDTPLLYYARDCWFIRMSSLRENLLSNNETVNWYPDNMKHGRFGNWLENVNDWSLSRERYWGTPLPVWECECGHTIAIGSVEELRKLSPTTPADIELHKPYIDDVLIPCEKCGSQMKRVPEVVDCWFDSGAMPFAQWHYPFENKELFEKYFPADFISEAVDQTRGWFYTLMAIGTLVFNKAPYKNVLVLGHVADKNGVKMSKHLGNGIDPWIALNERGADATRWYYYVSGAPWLANRFSLDYVAEAQRKFMGTFWNTYAFYVLYAEIDQFDPTKYALDFDRLGTMDRWILSRLHALIMRVNENLSAYEITESARGLNDFADELSNWYVRRCRERYWQDGMKQDKINAYMTLYNALVSLAKLSAPFCPFMTESIYLNLVKNLDADAPESIHLCDYPTHNANWMDTKLERDMDIAITVARLGHAARNEAAIKNRQPLEKLYLVYDDAAPDGQYADIIRDELNIKTLEIINDAERFVDYVFKPQLKVVGKKFGKLVPQLRNALAAANGSELMAELKRDGALNIIIDGHDLRLVAEDLLIETKRREGFASAAERGITVVLDTRLTPRLIEEGYMRELVSKAQTMRKEANFNVTDRIRLYYSGSDVIKNIFDQYGKEIASDVLADSIESALPASGALVPSITPVPGVYSKDWDINGEVVTMAVCKVQA
jgi:isoleucyl-tRNA synthetase